MEVSGGGENENSFNPRPRVGGDPGFGEDDARVGVSIHAPAWGATYLRVELFFT